MHITLISQVYYLKWRLSLEMKQCGCVVFVQMSVA